MNRRILLGALSVALLSACSKPQPVAEGPRPVMVQKLALSSVQAGALYSGEVRARYESDLAFRITGKIIERKVDVGAVVKPGQLLARLDPSDAGLNAEAARAQLAAAQNELTYAKAEVERYRDLVAKNFVSRSVLDAKETSFKSAAARVEQARAQATVAGNQAGYTSLVADQAGVITAITAEVGQVVKDSAPVMKLARDGEREVLIAVPESRIAALRKAGNIEVRLLAAPDAVFVGRVREVAPAADAATRTYAVRVTIVNATPEVQLGMTANVILPDAAAADGGLLVPATALFEHDGGSAVWVLQPEGELVKAVLRKVQVRQFREDGVLLTGGVQPGETIAAAGVHKIVAGQLMQPRVASRPAAATVGAGG
ncbi:efflux RND transporter periplasmic adaptor subunit [uncultured Zoogloea sp.]|uniref:efflux RND transporter periplasmic adaptor subunit n=1 Tax=uncultured Zoogloea sp. TaxID=160237 RepID=UPI00260733FF|nr:efflux RND transporter periplasmic adaptor subunit [uncultured Zoogloea sp.]